MFLIVGTETLQEISNWKIYVGLRLYNETTLENIDHDFT